MTSLHHILFKSLTLPLNGGLSSSSSSSSTKEPLNTTTTTTTMPPPNQKPLRLSADDIDAEAPRTRRNSLCNSCCACTSLILGLLLLLALIGGGVYYAFLQSNLPAVNLQRLDINKLESNRSRSDTLLTADFEIRLKFANKNGRIELSYRPMSASVSTEGINVGQVTIPAMRQRPNTETEVRVRTVMTRAAVEEAAARDVVYKANNHLMVMDVMVKGDVHFLIGGRSLKGFPFRVSCKSIDQSEIDNGRAPRCAVKMSIIY